MKTEKKKSKESLIGKIIYGFLLFMPLLSVLVTCLYVIQNENAYQSYGGETLNQSEYENITISNMEIGKDYYLITPTNQTYERQTDNTQFVVSNVYINETAKDVNQLRFYVNANSTTLTIQGIGNESFICQSNQANTLKFKFNGVNNNNYTSAINTILYNKTYVLSTYVSEVFYYSLSKTEESQYFNWAKNTALYTGVNEFTNTLGITTTYIPFLMTYWLLISVVYLIYDIALMMIHIAHNKVHQLEGSI